MPPASATRFAPAVCMTRNHREKAKLFAHIVVCGCPPTLLSFSDGNTLLAVDYAQVPVYIGPLCCFVLPFISPSPPSQIEARTMAHLARDERLLAIFNADHGTVRVVMHNLRPSLKLRWQVCGAANSWCVLRVAHRRTCTTSLQAPSLASQSTALPKISASRPKRFVTRW